MLRMTSGPKRWCYRPVGMLHTVMGLDPLQTHAAHLLSMGLRAVEVWSVNLRQAAFEAARCTRPRAPRVAPEGA